jgi:hypothetical protein
MFGPEQIRSFREFKAIWDPDNCRTITPNWRPFGVFQGSRLKLANGSAAVLYKIDQYHNCLEVYFPVVAYMGEF